MVPSPAKSGGGHGDSPSDDALALGKDAATLELFERVRGGDSTAFGELYRRYHDELLFAVRAHLGPRLRSKLESEDILQSVATDALRGLAGVRADTPGGLRAYLHAMVVNKIRGRADHFAADKRAGEVPLELGDDVADGEAPRYHEPETFERLERALEALPEEMRAVVVLRKIDGLSSKEAADRLGRTDDSTRKLYSRAIARLTLLLDPSDGGGS